jgi:hypothetical protein
LHAPTAHTPAAHTDDARVVAHGAHDVGLHPKSGSVSFTHEPSQIFSPGWHCGPGGGGGVPLSSSGGGGGTVASGVDRIGCAPASSSPEVDVSGDEPPPSIVAFRTTSSPGSF